MNVTYVCGVTGMEVSGTTEVLPNGWLIPPHDVSRDVYKDVPTYGTIVALSSDDIWRQLLKRRLERR